MVISPVLSQQMDHFSCFGFFSPQVKTQLQDRLQELQPLPEMLKNTELRLHESEDSLRNSERRNMENNKVIAELQTKVCSSFDKYML